MRYDEYPDLGCCRNCRIPDRVRIHRLLLPLPPPSRLRDLKNPRRSNAKAESTQARQKCRAFRFVDSAKFHFRCFSNIQRKRNGA